MLNIWYRGGDIKVMTNAPSYFNVAFRPEWFEDDLVKKMIKDVDKSDVIGPYLIISPVLGPIAPTYLSGGVKVLILLLKEPKFIYNLSNCGDNCAKWILEICKDRDIVAYLEHVMHFKDPFEIKVLNTGNVVPIFCPKCKQECLIDVDNMKIRLSVVPDAKTQSR